MVSATLKIHCTDKKGIISSISSFIYRNNGNIITLDEFVDPPSNTFFMRLEWDISAFTLSREQMESEIATMGQEYNYADNCQIFYSDRKPRLAIFVSKYDHCLWDILLRYKAGELKCDIPLIISNHPDLKQIADLFGIDYKVVKVNPENKLEAENEQTLLISKYNIDFMILARYMQVLSPEFVARFENRIINIHHSFLPAFEGARPYHQAIERGVKLVGATAHFVNNNLDKGPIISQSTMPISHEDSVEDLMVKGRDIEKLVLSQAMKIFLDHRIFVHNNRTIIL
ncbi:MULTISPECIES: formyltetrahydrofolate deformylase [Dehalococcoides]|jgi:formyltetrahydrofolate deformylase|uniref:Formyltetrahydrofolate deformylase n=3 Tax=Dehalococcoides mccartyi TaxID=61435 RepID=A0A142VAM4_9CHLR|nr:MULTISPECIES: formyltetrahydrofolate deformylase [Dehalococcoides]AGG06700.1 formyltetrahydrofolate deformylase [Dehalococcoides mccartyi DCMB5]AII61199.1 formyltetrahydrofolate deformylase [Dehalococcoides mccartyi CG5]AMU86893.1 formyltetrahydrofolate deformylase [Dehalococcoides mccartyi]AOV99683.1 formyltetrahydrofolate deformylase [Dehalococcoides mccartyi]MBA2085462.1 Formyltetrahydrofolate deformylase [Dehalococcoides mccartyi]